MEEKKDKQASNNWLQRLKDESWEAEVLVSTVAIYGTYQMFDLIRYFTNVIINILDPSQYLIGYGAIALGLFGVSILLSMFLIHFCLRAYWVGLVGLNSVFPDYSIESSAFSELYTKKMLSILPKLKDSIQKVDDLCSVIFSAAFTFLMIYLYMAFLIGLYLFLYNLLLDYLPAKILKAPAYVLGGVLIVQMVTSILANLKQFKHVQWLQLLYFKLNKYCAKLLYGPFYKSILQVTMIFGSNFKKNRGLTYLMVLFLFFGSMVSVIQIGKTNIPYLINYDSSFEKNSSFTGYYASANENSDFLLAPEIESDIISSNILKLFVPVFAYEKKYRERVCGAYNGEKDRFSARGRADRREYQLDCFEEYIQVYLNGELVKSEFIRAEHQVTGQMGLSCFLELNETTRGLNEIFLIKHYKSDTLAQYHVPFYFNSEGSRPKAIE